MSATKKYRPYFTLPELKTISSALKNTQSPSLPLVRYIDKYISDIEAGLRQESFTLAPSIEQKLGLTSPAKSSTITDLVTLYNSQGNFESFTPAQIKLLQEHRYLQGLMSPEEESEYERNLLS